MKYRNVLSLVSLAPLIILLPSVSASAYEINDSLLIEGSLTGVYQYADTNVQGLRSTDRGALPFDLGVNVHPTDNDQFQGTLSYAVHNGLNEPGLFSLAPYADDLEDDVKDINGRNRDYLLEAWYKHTFMFSDDIFLGVTGGIIDSTAYIDDNDFANCEVSQFMNDIFVNNTLANLPSYDIGGVAEFKISGLSLKGLFMTSKNESDKEYTYYAFQAGYSADTPMGTGNYRLYGYITNDRFEGWNGSKGERLRGIGVSCDHQLTDTLRLFARLGCQDDDAAVDHDAVYSGGVNVSGRLWGREGDEIGVGYAYLDGAPGGDIDTTNAVEVYVKLTVSDFSDITLDIQYINDERKTDKNREGFIYGTRLNACF